MRESLTKRERLRSRDDFGRMFSEGKVIKTDHCKLIFRENGLNANRLGITFPRKFGSAVERNRMKRVCRASFRGNKIHFRTGYDCLFIFYRFHRLYAPVDRALCRLLKRATVWKD